MIEYSHRSTLSKLFQMKGSVFPQAIMVAGPCGFFTGLLTLLIHYLEIIPGSNDSGFRILSDNAAWSGFSFLVGFLSVFRTSQAYNRFWDGCTSSHKMRAEWFDGCSSLLAFTKHSEAPTADIENFKGILVRLFSMLHACALATLEEAQCECDLEVQAFKYDLLDPTGIDDESLRVIKESECKVELIFQWIQQLIVEQIRNDVLSIPPPILSRCFQELANGMVAFHDAMKISEIPFPFPYTQVCDVLLVFHWMLVPFVVSQWVNNVFWAVVFGMVQVFVLWSLNFIAIELENPFGEDPNDLDGFGMQLEVNAHLILLTRPSTNTTPKLSIGRAVELDNLQDCRDSFTTAWDVMEADTETHCSMGHYQKFAHRAATKPFSKMDVSGPSRPSISSCDSHTDRRSSATRTNAMDRFIQETGHRCSRERQGAVHPSSSAHDEDTYAPRKESSSTVNSDRLPSKASEHSANAHATTYGQRQERTGSLHSTASSKRGSPCADRLDRQVSDGSNFSHKAVESSTVACYGDHQLSPHEPLGSSTEMAQPQTFMPASLGPPTTDIANNSGTPLPGRAEPGVFDHPRAHFAPSQSATQYENFAQLVPQHEAHSVADERNAAMLD